MHRIHGFVLSCAIIFGSCTASRDPVGGADIFEGVITIGFEDQSFLPCGSSERWMLAGSEDVVRELHDRYRQMTRHEHDRIFVRLRGDVVDRSIVSAPYTYQRHFLLNEVMLMRAWQDSDCAE